MVVPHSLHNYKTMHYCISTEALYTTALTILSTLYLLRLHLLEMIALKKSASIPENIVVIKFFWTVRKNKNSFSISYQEGIGIIDSPGNSRLQILILKSVELASALEFLIIWLYCKMYYFYKRKKMDWIDAIPEVKAKLSICYQPRRYQKLLPVK